MGKKESLSANNWIIKSNTLNEIRRNRMTVSQIKLFSIYLSKINPYKLQSREVTFPLDEYARIMQFKKANTTRLMQTADDLLGLTVTFRDNDGGFTACQIFKRFKLFKNENDEWCVTIDCHDDIQHLMFDLKKYFFKYRLWNTLQLTSANQQRMYEILKQYETAGAREISVKDLREFLGLKPEEYSLWQNFKTRILDASQEALANYTDIKFTWEVTGKRGQGGKIKTIKFNIEPNNNYLHQLTLDDYLKEQEQPDFEDEPKEFMRESIVYENESLAFLAEACENSFSEGQMQELFYLVNKAIPHTKNKATTEQERYVYLAEKYTYSKNRATGKGKVFNYLKKVLEADTQKD